MCSYSRNIISHSQLHRYGVTLANSSQVKSDTVLPATRHKWSHPVLTHVRQAGTRFTYPGGMEGWVDLGDLLHTDYRDGFPARRRSHIQVLTGRSVDW